MSQSTADDLLTTLGLKPVQMNAVERDNSQRTSSEPAPRSKSTRVVVAIVSAALLGTGFKLIGDYAADCAIDVWANRQAAAFTVPSALAEEVFAKAAQEEAANETTLANTPSIGVSE